MWRRSRGSATNPAPRPQSSLPGIPGAEHGTVPLPPGSAPCFGAGTVPAIKRAMRELLGPGAPCQEQTGQPPRCHHLPGLPPCHQQRPSLAPCCEQEAGAAFTSRSRGGWQPAAAFGASLKLSGAFPAHLGDPPAAARPPRDPHSPRGMRSASSRQGDREDPGWSPGHPRHRDDRRSGGSTELPPHILGLFSPPPCPSPSLSGSHLISSASRSRWDWEGRWKRCSRSRFLASNPGCGAAVVPGGRDVLGGGAEKRGAGDLQHGQIKPHALCLLFLS